MNQMRDPGPRPRGFAEKPQWTMTVQMETDKDGRLTRYSSSDVRSIPCWPRRASGGEPDA